VREDTLRFKKIGANFWKYFVVCLADVEANYLMIKAYSYTKMTTIQVGITLVRVGVDPGKGLDRTPKKLNQADLRKATQLG
jgi:hypothetical protein